MSRSYLRGPLARTLNHQDTANTDDPSVSGFNPEGDQMLTQTTTWDIAQGTQPAPYVPLPTEEDTHAPCGTWHASGKPETGKPVHYQQFCEHWRDEECPVCFKRRTRRLRSEIGRAYLEEGEEDFYVVLLSRPQASAFAKLCTLSGSLYRRYPTELWDYIIFQPFLNCPGSDLPWQDLDWKLLANTPKGRRPSGKLGVAKPKVNPGPVYKAEIITIEYDAPAAVVKEAWKLAVEETSDANPHTPQQAEVEMNRRLIKVSFYIGQLGGKVIKQYVRTVNIAENSVLSWSYKDTIEELDDLVYLEMTEKTGHEGIAIPF